MGAGVVSHIFRRPHRLTFSKSVTQDWTRFFPAIRPLPVSTRRGSWPVAAAPGYLFSPHGWTKHLPGRDTAIRAEDPFPGPQAYASFQVTSLTSDRRRLFPDDNKMEGLLATLKAPYHHQSIGAKLPASRWTVCIISI